MVYINLRLNVADFNKWLAGFHGFESYRKENGSTGVNQIYHDVANPNDVTLLMEWESAEKAQAFINNRRHRAANRGGSSDQGVRIISARHKAGFDLS